MTPAEFKKIVWAHYKKHGRHNLPWRPPTLKLRRDNTLDLYRVLVSEIMLQQTQVERAIPFYKNFIRQFPTAKKLAAAPLSEVVKAWQGLGYNRRAKMLHQAAKERQGIHVLSYRIKHEYLLNSGKLNFPALVTELEKLPGVGTYTARAVAAFAYNQDVIVVETNIRTAVIHHFFTSHDAGTSLPRCAPAARPIQHLGKNMPASRVTDTEIAEVLARVLPKGRAREWYSALMDYGAHLKHSGISHNAKSTTYTKQAKFSGSLREARGAILREFTKGVTSRTKLVNLLGSSRKEQMKVALNALMKEGLVI